LRRWLDGTSRRQDFEALQVARKSMRFSEKKVVSESNAAPIRDSGLAFGCCPMLCHIPQAQLRPPPWPAPPAGSGGPTLPLSGRGPRPGPAKSDLRSHWHQAIVQPRLCDCLVVTQITLKTEGPRGLPSDTGLRLQADPPWRLPRYACPVSSS
jgi:hypothetical protein